MSWYSTDKTNIKKEVRKFGYVAFLFFGCLFGIGLYLNKEYALIFFGSLSALGLGFIIFPQACIPLYQGWLRVAAIMNKTVIAILLILIYFLVITPAGLLRRLLSGTTIMPLKPDKQADSYWVERETPWQPIHRFIKRY